MLARINKCSGSRNEDYNARIPALHTITVQKHVHAIRNYRQEPNTGLDAQMTDRHQAAPVADYCSQRVRRELLCFVPGGAVWVAFELRLLARAGT